MRKENGLKIAIERSKRKLAFCILSVSDLSKGQQLLAQGNRPGYKAAYQTRPERAKALIINAFALSLTLQSVKRVLNNS